MVLERIALTTVQVNEYHGKVVPLRDAFDVQPLEVQ
jgi:hypothetical protein